MTPRQKKFCLEYAQTGNATTAAISAGYSERSAYAQGCRLLRNAEVREFLSALAKTSDTEAVADVQEVKTHLSRILRDQAARNSDRAKAADLLLKSAGAFCTQQGSTTPELVDQSEETTVALPLTDGDPVQRATALLLPSGDILPLPGHEHDDLLFYVDARRYLSEAAQSPLEPAEA